MTKSLEAIERLAFEIACCRCQYWGNEGCSIYHKNNEGHCIWVDIEKELKALEIIRKKDKLKLNSINGIDVLIKNITQEECELLKEIFDEKD